MYKRLKKVPPYLLKLIKTGKLREVKELYQRVDSSIFLNALAARLDRRPFLAYLKDFGPQEINTYLDLLPYRRQHVEEYLFFWEINKRRFLATPMQFWGLHKEYLQGVFHSHYAFPWQEKRVLDIGGFIGDSALYFLENGAKKVTIYEPLVKNIKALKFNLEAYPNQVEVHQKAIAEKTGRVRLASKEPIGSLGFGMEEGSYQIDCEGVTFTQLLSSHAFDIAKIDCEGAERFLSDVKDTLIKSIPYWIIETHSPSIYQSINQAFIQHGFKKLRDFALSPDVNLLHFERKEVY
jgi:FkbM family methyltransferase